MAWKPLPMLTGMGAQRVWQVNDDMLFATMRLLPQGHGSEYEIRCERALKLPPGGVAGHCALSLGF